jgi:RNA polymerase sigma-70 factor (ECF subfamily)
MVVEVDPVRAEIIALLPRLRRFARALAGTVADADDLVQDTVERALTRIALWTPGTRLDSWMFRIAQNIWIDRTRSRRSKGTLVDIDSLDNALARDGAQEVEARLTLQSAARALMELPEEQRSVVALVLVDGMSYRQAADVLEVPIGTVTSRLARARTYLAERVFGAEAGEGVVS